MTEPRAFWVGRRVFLTGHTGFKGSWMALLLNHWGASVHGFALPPQNGIYKAANVAETLQLSTYGDIRDPDAVRSAMRKADPEIVFHLAAQPLVRESYQDPVGTYATNVMGTVHVADAVRSIDSIRAMVVVTSDKCYENKEWLWGYREDEPMGGYDPYSNSKGCSELVTASFRHSFFAKSGQQVASGRAGNVIGGGDWAADRLVPDLIRSLQADEQIVLRNPRAIRPWQHVLEPVMGYLQLAEHLLSPGGEAFACGWNFGPDSSSERTVEDVTRTVCTAWGREQAWHLDQANHVHEAHFLKLDSARARSLLRWRARWDFEASIHETVKWYHAEASGADMRAFTLGQISQYLALGTAPLKDRK